MDRYSDIYPSQPPEQITTFLSNQKANNKKLESVDGDFVTN